MARSAPQEQSIVIRLPDTSDRRTVTRVSGVITRQGDAEPSAGFSQDFPSGAPRSVRYAFSGPSGAYIVVITLQGAPGQADSGDNSSIPPETTFERRVSLVGGEVIVSPD